MTEVKEMIKCSQCSMEREKGDKKAIPFYKLKADNSLMCQKCMIPRWEARYQGEDAMWKVTRDWIDCDRKGTTSYGFREDVFNALEKWKYKAYDDDHNLCFDFTVTCACSFSPLDDFAMPDVGATYLKVKNNSTGEWEHL
jgi:hypothetical protein